MLLATGYKAENIKEYRYFDNGTNSLDFDGLCADLEVTWLSIHVSGQLNFIYLPTYTIGHYRGHYRAAPLG